jgi:hypothetical protein
LQRTISSEKGQFAAAKAQNAASGKNVQFFGYYQSLCLQFWQDKEENWQPELSVKAKGAGGFRSPAPFALSETQPWCG